MDAFSTVLIIVAALLLWGVPIYFGIRTAKRKDLSPHWMWFGVHPIFGWIALAVLAAVKPSKKCSHCGARLKADAKFCSSCGSPCEEIPITQPPVYSKVSRKKKIILGVAIGLGAFLLFCLLVLSIVSKAFTSSWAYKSALDVAENSRAVSIMIGEPIQQRGLTTGSINTTGSAGEADLRIPIRGSSGKGTLSVYAEKRAGEWTVLSLEFKDSDTSDTIRLIE